MKKIVFALLALFYILSVHASDEKMKLRLPHVKSQSESMILFDATARYTFVYDTSNMVAQMDIHLMKKNEDESYGYISICNMTDTLTPQQVYKITSVGNIDGDLFCKRISYVSTIGKREHFDANITFMKHNHNYSLWLFEKPHYFAEMNNLIFVSKLRVTPRAATEKELKQDSIELAREKASVEYRQQMAKNEKTIELIYLIVSVILTVIAIAHMIWFMSVSFRSHRLGSHLLLSAIAIFSSSAPLFSFMPYLPAYYLTYYMIVNPQYTSWEIERKFIRLIKIGGIIGIVLALFVPNLNSLLYIVQWVVGYWVCWMYYTRFIEHSRCGHCSRYGVHPIIKRELLWMRHIHTEYTKHVHTNTEERSDKIIHWYEKRYGYKLERESHFKDFRECHYCHEIFITQSMELKTVLEDGYVD